jgi:predicted nucleic acid-binding protein
MSLILCDTNVFISLFAEIPATISTLQKIGSKNVLVSSVSVMELYRGMENKKEMRAMAAKINQYNILHFTEDASTKALELLMGYKLSHNLTIPDAIIGAMSIVFNLPLFTYNAKDFKYMPGIQLYPA